jgi:hypothetical protein
MASTGRTHKTCRTCAPNSAFSHRTEQVVRQAQASGRSFAAENLSRSSLHYAITILVVHAPDRELAVHAVDTLNDLIGDFVCGVNVLNDSHVEHQAGKLDAKVMLTVSKMCLSHLVLGLAKFDEFNRRFSKVIPSEYRPAVKGLVRTIKEKEIVTFRNKCVGHIWDEEIDRPLVHSEILARLSRITENDLDGFLRWVNNPAANTCPTTVVGIVEALRDAIMARYSIESEEFIGR